MNNQKIFDMIVSLARSRSETCGSWSRADLSCLTMGKLAIQRPEIIAAYLGGARADVISGTYGNSGESWSYDSGRNVSYGDWEIRPDLMDLIKSDQGQRALEIARSEVRSFRCKAYKATRDADHTWVRWVLGHTPLASTELVISVGWNFPPRDSIDYYRAKALAERVVRKHSKLHTAYIARTEDARRLADIQKVRKDWKLFPKHASSRLHPEANALLARIRFAQERAKGLRCERLVAERENRREEQIRQPVLIESQPKKDTGFLGKGAWGALDDLKL